MPHEEEDMSVSIMLPAYGEEENLATLIPAISEQLDALALSDREILVVLPSDASDSEMQDVLQLGGQPIARTPSNSFGDAIRSGIAEISSRSKWTVVMDADGSHSPETLPRLLNADTGSDVVVASRYVSGGSSDNSLQLRMMSRLLNVVYGAILGIRCKDISTNFKRYRSRDLKNLELKAENFDIVEEILYRTSQLHGQEFTILEIPDHFYERRFGETKRNLNAFIISYVFTLVKLRLSQKPGTV